MVVKECSKMMAASFNRNFGNSRLKVEVLNEADHQPLKVGSELVDDRVYQQIMSLQAVGAV
jgi:hypothetical protein